MGLTKSKNLLEKWECMRIDAGNVPTKASVQSNKQLADAEGDGGVSRDDDGLVPTFGISAVVDLKLRKNQQLETKSGEAS